MGCSPLSRYSVRRSVEAGTPAPTSVARHPTNGTNPSPSGDPELGVALRAIGGVLEAALEGGALADRVNEADSLFHPCYGLKRRENLSLARVPRGSTGLRPWLGLSHHRMR